MKKVLFYIVLTFAFSISNFAQGVEFHQGDWASVKAKAKEENKIIFIDFYTSWCGPCKGLVKNVFPLKEVGDFYNANFINYKIDAEKGEGPALAEKYGVKAYPTLMFVDAEGQFLHQQVGGANGNSLILLGQTALNPDKRYGNNLGRLEKETNLAEVPAQLKELKQNQLPYSDMYIKYINSLKKRELYSQATFDLMTELSARTTTCFTFQYLLENKNQFEKVVGEKPVDDYFFKIYMSKAFTVINNNGSIEDVYAEIQKNGFEFTDKLKESFELSYLIHDQKFDEFISAAELYVNKYGINNDPALIHRRVFMEGLKFFNKSKEIENYIVEVAHGIAAANYKAFDTYAYVGWQYSNAGNYSNAVKYYNTAIESASGEEMEIESITKRVKLLEKKIEVIEKGDYTIQVSDLDKYNEHSFFINYLSATEIGKKVEKEIGKIIDGQILISGNTRSPLIANWFIKDDNKIIDVGQFIIQAGHYTAKFGNKSILVENSDYNDFVYNYLNKNKKYIAAKEQVESFNLEDMSSAYLEKTYKQLVINEYKRKQEYYSAMFVQIPNQQIKLYIFYVANFGSITPQAQEQLHKLRAEYGDHYLFRLIEKK